MKESKTMIDHQELDRRVVTYAESLNRAGDDWEQALFCGAKRPLTRETILDVAAWVEEAAAGAWEMDPEQCREIARRLTEIANGEPTA